MEFLGLRYSSFHEIAPTLPRHTITLARLGYLRRELLAWGRAGEPLRTHTLVLRSANVSSLGKKSR
jgi:hypothetical protein